MTILFMLFGFDRLLFGELEPFNITVGLLELIFAGVYLIDTKKNISKYRESKKEEIFKDL
ncbi:MAG: hypothetical protein SLAVMIC_00810 [uncultured marine phage]|uniref:Uncharacterized protein n=1 Tax=uncultured marine phage TaxID=707152 RepID=A0A8D9FSF9_9VIRU|nr:MAG: hypothetical protein SLAVMIC_00810 [uncultured marine phage]